MGLKFLLNIDYQLFIKNKYILKKSKFIILVQKCSKKELEEFKDWLYSPAHNKSEQVKTLFQFVLKAAPTFEKVDKKEAFQAVFGHQRYNELKINNVISLLTRQLLDFLGFKNYQNSRHLAQICLMDELLQRDFDKLMLQEGQRLVKEKSKSSIQNSSTFFDEYLYYKQLDEQFLKKPKREYDENLQQKNNNLDLFYIATKLKIACDMVSRNTVIQANYQIHHFKDLMDWIENNEFQYLKYPAIGVYYQALKTIQTGKIEDYKVLKSLLAENLHIFPNTEISKVYDYALNFCIRQINQGNAAFYNEILELYKFLLENKIIFVNGYLAQWDYKNIITVGTRLGETVWTEQFILDYKKHLPPKDRENAFIYNLASFYYSTKAYKKSLQLLHEVKFTDASYHLGAKIIQLKSFYELEEDEPFYALIDAFKIYILRSKDISTYRKQANLNLIKFAKRIYKLKEQQDLISPSVFMQKWESINCRLTQTQNVANKTWLESSLKHLFWLHH